MLGGLICLCYCVCSCIAVFGLGWFGVCNMCLRSVSGLVWGCSVFVVTEVLACLVCWFIRFWVFRWDLYLCLLFDLDLMLYVFLFWFWLIDYCWLWGVCWFDVLGCDLLFCCLGLRVQLRWVGFVLLLIFGLLRFWIVAFVTVCCRFVVVCLFSFAAVFSCGFCLEYLLLLLWLIVAWFCVLLAWDYRLV